MRKYHSAHLETKCFQLISFINRTSCLPPGTGPLVLPWKRPQQQSKIGQEPAAEMFGLRPLLRLGTARPNLGSGKRWGSVSKIYLGKVTSVLRGGECQRTGQV